jgi:sugar phosphate isomerase/epimerase
MKLSAVMRRGEGDTWAALARRASGLGFRGVSLPFDPTWGEAELVSMREAFDTAGVGVVALECDGNFLTPSEEVCRRGFGLLRRALEAGALLNCDHVVTHAGTRHPDPSQPLATHPDNWADAAWDLLVKRVWALLDEVEDVGVRLCFEPHPATTLNTLDSLANLMADAASVRVRVALDPAAIIGAEAAAQPTRALAEIFASLADTIAVARATDLRLLRSGDEPLVEPAPLGEGVLDYPTYLRLVNALELDTPLIVPLQGSDAAYRTAHAFLAAAAKR